jgi:hypothetical protein
MFQVGDRIRNVDLVSVGDGAIGTVSKIEDSERVWAIWDEPQEYESYFHIVHVELVEPAKPRPMTTTFTLEEITSYETG